VRYQLSFEITEDGFADYLRWRQRTASMVVAVISLAVLALNGLSLRLGVPLLLALIFSTPAFLLLIASQTSYLDRWRIRRHARSLLGSTAKFDIGLHGIDSELVGMASQVGWDTVTNIHDNGRVVIVARDRLPVLWIPASAFASAAQRDEIVSFMRDQISAARRGRRSE
jgi:hypothetical protein